MRNQFYKWLSIFAASPGSIMLFAKYGYEKDSGEFWELLVKVFPYSLLLFGFSLYHLYRPIFWRPDPSGFYQRGQLRPIRFQRRLSTALSGVLWRSVASAALFFLLFSAHTELAAWLLLPIAGYLSVSAYRRMNSRILNCPYLLIDANGITYWSGRSRPKFFAWKEIRKISMYRKESQGRHEGFFPVRATSTCWIPPEELRVDHLGHKKSLSVPLELFGNRRFVAACIEEYAKATGLGDETSSRNGKAA